MALRFATGFEGYDSSGNRTALDPDWDFTFDVAAAQAGLETPGRVSGRQAFIAESSSSGGTSVSGILLPVSGYSSNSTWICGYSHKFTGNNYLSLPTFAATNALFQFLDSEGAAMLTVYARGGTITVRNGDHTGTVLGVAAANFHSMVNHFVECKVTFHDSTGAVDIRVHEQNVLSLSGVDTKGTTADAPTQILFAATNNISEAANKHAQIDDLYVCDGVDGTGIGQVASFDDFLGDIGLKRLDPTSDGSSEDWTLSTGADSWALVDDDPPDGDSTYIESQTANHVTLFGFENMPSTPEQVEAVIMNSYGKKTDAGSRTFTHRVLSVATGQDGSTIAPATDYQFHQNIFTEDPDATARWDESSINAMEAGVKVIA